MAIINSFKKVANSDRKTRKDKIRFLNLFPNIIEDYNDGLSFKKLSNKYNVGEKTINNEFIKQNIKLRTKKESIELQKRQVVGCNHYSWKGGKTKHPAGHIYLSNNGKRILEHHKVWIQNNNLPIPENHEIHHIDFNPENNNISNLMSLPKSFHKSLHSTKRIQENPELKYFGKNIHLRGR